MAPNGILPRMKPSSHNSELGKLNKATTAVLAQSASPAFCLISHSFQTNSYQTDEKVSNKILFKNRIMSRVREFCMEC